jgi:hypothetical protein
VTSRLLSAARSGHPAPSQPVRALSPRALCDPHGRNCGFCPESGSRDSPRKAASEVSDSIRFAVG